MIDGIAAAVAGSYYLLLGILSLYGAHRLLLTIHAFSRKRTAPAGPGPRQARVTVQLPVYNEMYVLDRLVQAACALRHPRGLLEIQILDDSTDGTTARARRLAAEGRRRGIDIQCIHRESRAGFKAGALAEGLRRARGEYIALFDADFVPPPDFLERSLPAFEDPMVGMVQARWTHLNRTFSWLTRAQALMLDAHFGVEHAARHRMGRLFNFNGTAGIFRKDCIEDAGGWRADTLTEDLDLSYRAQLEGWRFIFLDDLECPAELPVELNSLRTQQHRWAKGSVQTARRLLPRILRSGLPPASKAEAVFHLTNNGAYLLLFLAGLLMLPALVLGAGLGWTTGWLDAFFISAGAGGFAISCAASRAGSREGLLSGILEAPLVMTLGAGLALNNSIAVLEAMLGHSSGFLRTPKFRIALEGPEDLRGRPDWRRLAYRGRPSRLAPVEGCLALLFLAGIAWAWARGLYLSIPFMALFACGYGSVAVMGLVQEAGLRNRARDLAGEGAGP